MNINTSSKEKIKTIKNKDFLKAKRANKKLTSLLTQKMFKGYLNIKKWNKIKNDPHKMHQLIKSVEDQNCNPLTENYNLYYKANIIGSLFPQIDFNPSIEINSASQLRTSSAPKLNESKLFLTNEDKLGLSSNSKIDLLQLSDKSNTVHQDSRQYSQSQKGEGGFYPRNLYLNETEENAYSKFPFIIINKNQEEDYVSNQQRPSISSSLSTQQRNMIKDKQKERILQASQSEFLFRISHRKDPSQYHMSFHHNKALTKPKSNNNIFHNKKLKEQDKLNFWDIEIKNDIKQSAKPIKEKLNRISILQKGINEVFESIRNFEYNFRFKEFFEEAKIETKPKEDKPDIALPKEKPKPVIQDIKLCSEQKPINKCRSILASMQRNRINEEKDKNARMQRQNHNDNKEILKKQRRFHFSLSKEDSVSRKPEATIPKIYKKQSTIRDNQILSALYQNFNQKDIANILGSTRLMFNSLSQAKMILKKKKSFVD